MFIAKANKNFSVEFSARFFLPFALFPPSVLQSASIKSNEAKWNATRIRKHVADLSLLFERGMIWKENSSLALLRITIFIAFSSYMKWP